MKLLPWLFLCCALPLPLSAEDKSEKSAPATQTNLSQFTFGKTLSGTEVTSESLKGKPVLVEYWGVNCPTCLAKMPEINAIAKRYDSKGLVVIGAHSQDGSEAEILKMVKKLKMKFPVTEGASGPVKVTGLPHSAIFAADGTMVFEGSPLDKNFERGLREALKSKGKDAKTP